jgi:hypothetical protein
MFYLSSIITCIIILILIGASLIGALTIWNIVWISTKKIISKATAPTPALTPIPTPTLPQYDSKMPFNFTIKTSELMEGRTTNLQIIFDIEYLMNFYKLEKMRIAYYTDLPVTTVDYHIESPTNDPRDAIDLKVNSSNFLDLIIFAVPVGSAIKTDNKTITVTENDKNRVVAELKKLYS